MPATIPTATPSARAVAGGTFLTADAAFQDVLTPEDLDELQLQVRSTTERFMREEVLPKIPELERQEPGLARKLIRQAAEIGLLGVLVPERHDGMEMDLTSQMVVCEGLGPYASFSTTYGAHAGIGTLPLVFFGTPEQQRRYLPRLVAGDMLGAYCLSEPQAGSDSRASLTRAERSPDGRHYVLNGQKMWISNGAWADLYTVFAKVDGDQFTAFLVERGWEGVSPGAEEHKMGLKGSSTTALYLDNVRVPAENVLGDIGSGHVIAFNVLNLGRLQLAAACVGGSVELTAEAVDYATHRKAFGHPIAHFGAIRQKLADMAARTFAGAALVYRTSGMIDARLEDFSWDSPDAARTALNAVEEYAVECSIAKVYLSEGLDFVVDEAVQIHGGYGYHADYAVERGYRDSRINRIYEGTNEINRLLTTAMILKRAQQGRLDLLGAIEALAERTEGRGLGQDGPLGRSRSALDGAKRATVLAVGLAWKRFGAQLKTQQEVCSALADLCMEVYALESALLRAEKLEDAGRTGVSADILAVLTQHAIDSVRSLGRLVLGACCSGSELEKSAAALEGQVRTVPFDLPAARDRITARLLETGGRRL